jgi:hypothetical protein
MHTQIVTRRSPVRVTSRRLVGVVLGLLALAPAVGDADTQPKASPPSAAVTTHDGASDFDFVLGRWKVKNRVLSKRLAGSASWYEFDATSVNRPIWDGKANIEDWDGTSPRGRIQGLGVRLYDPATKRWSVYWADQRTGILGLPAMVGSFKDGVGEFFSDGSFEGKPTRERVIWSRITKDSCRWEQALSVDGGKTWETNWIMDFTRITPQDTGDKRGSSENRGRRWSVTGSDQPLLATCAGPARASLREPSLLRLTETSLETPGSCMVTP